MRHTLAILAFFVLSITVISSCDKEPEVLHSDWVIKKGRICDIDLGGSTLTVTSDLITFTNTNLNSNKEETSTRDISAEEWNELVKLIDLEVFRSIPNNNTENYLNKGCNDWYSVNAEGRIDEKFTDDNEVVSEISKLQAKLKEIENSMQ